MFVTEGVAAVNDTGCIVRSWDILTDDRIGGTPGTAVDVDMVAWAKGMEVNVASMVMMSKYAIPEMEKNDGSRGYKGSIINMGSVAGIRGGTPHLLYPTSKGKDVRIRTRNGLC